MKKVANPDIVLKLRNEGKTSKEIGKILGCSGNNINKVLRNNFNLKVVNPYRHNTKYKVNSDFFDNINENSCYILGLLYADGCVCSKYNRIILGLIKSDYDILNKINNLIQPEKPISIRKVKKNNCQDMYVLTINDNKIREKLISIGCTPRKSLTLKWPLNYVNDENLSHFIRGYLDGDGCIYAPKNIKKCCICIVGSKYFINSLKLEIENKLDINCCIRKHPKSPKINLLYIYGGKQTEIFGDWLYKNATIYLKRKYDKYLLIKNRPNKRVNRG